MGITNFDIVQANAFIPGFGVRAGLGGPGPLTTYRGQQATGSIGSNVFFVNSAVAGATDSLAYGLSPTAPMKSINFAVSQCVANNGDLVVAGPGHIESVVAAAGLTIAVAGVTVLFLGNRGPNRAMIRFSVSTAAQVVISANDVRLVGPRFENMIDALVSGVSVTGLRCEVDDAEWVDDVATNTLIGWITTAAAKRLWLNGYRYYEDKTGGGTQKTEHIRIVGGDHHRFSDVHVTGDFTTGCWNNITTLSSELLFERCSFNNLNATPHVAIAILTTSPGVAFDTLLVVASGSTWITASNKIAFDLASSGVIPGGTPASPV